MLDLISYIFKDIGIKDIGNCGLRPGNYIIGYYLLAIDGTLSSLFSLRYLRTFARVSRECALHAWTYLFNISNFVCIPIVRASDY